jgi:hypothetical protein
MSISTATLETNDIVDSKKRNRILAAIIVVLLVVAAVLAIGAFQNQKAGQSKALFSHTDELDVSVGTGNVTIIATGDVTFSNIMPGDSQVTTFEVANTGTSPARLTFGQPLTVDPSSDISSVDPANLALMQLAIYRNTVNGAVLQPLTPMVNLPATVDLGIIQPGDTKKFAVQVLLDVSAGNDWETVQFGATHTLTAVQD